MKDYKLENAILEISDKSITYMLIKSYQLHFKSKLPLELSKKLLKSLEYQKPRENTKCTLYPIAEYESFGVQTIVREPQEVVDSLLSSGVYEDCKRIGLAIYPPIREFKSKVIDILPFLNDSVVNSISKDWEKVLLRDLQAFFRMYKYGDTLVWSQLMKLLDALKIDYKGLTSILGEEYKYYNTVKVKEINRNYSKEALENFQNQIKRILGNITGDGIVYS